MLLVSMRLACVSILNVEDSSPERLAVREEVTKARISSLSRKL